MKSWTLYRRPGRAEVQQSETGGRISMNVCFTCASFVLFSGAAQWIGPVHPCCGRGSSEAVSLHHTNNTGTADALKIPLTNKVLSAEQICVFLSYTCCYHLCFFLLQTVLGQIGNILKQAEQIVVTLTDVELPQWKHRQQMACVGSPVDTSLDHLEKW